MAFKSKSAMKRVKTSKQRQARNLAVKGEIKRTFKSAEKAIAGKSAEASDLVKKAVSVIDKAVQRGMVHKNKANRKKSRLLLKYNKTK